MKDIRLTYFNTEICFSTYFLTFFRMVGIYVHERVLQVNEENKYIYDKEDEDIINIFIIRDKLEQEKLYPYMKNKGIFLLSDALRVFDEEKVVIYDEESSKLWILKKIIGCLAEDYEEFNRGLSDLLLLAHIYDNNLLMETFLGTRFFIPNKFSYKHFCLRYMRSIERIANNRKITGDGSFADFAMAYLAYEYNYYCKRLEKVFLYDVDSILELIQELQAQSDDRWDSLVLLLAQINGDLLEKYDEALRYYLLVTDHSYNAFAWYKIGYIYKNHIGDYNRALNCFNNAVKINPLYYRAVYQMGTCQYTLRKRHKARDAFYNLVAILLDKDWENILRPMEVEYLYKTYVFLARMEYRIYGDIYRSIHWYQDAEELWMRADADRGRSLIEQAKYNKKIMKKQFALWVELNDISVIREQIYSLYKSVEDEEGMQLYKQFL